MKRASKRPVLVGLVCLLAVVLAGLMAVAIVLGSREQPQQMRETTVPPTLAPTTPPPTTQPTTPAPTTQPPQSTPAPTQPPAPMVLAQALEEEWLVWQDRFILSGTGEPGALVTALGLSTTVGQDGSFSLEVPLEMGLQTITVQSGQDTASCQVERRYGMQFYSPSTKTAYHPDQSLLVEVAAKEGSELKVEFRGEEITMRPSVDQVGRGCLEGYTFYTGFVILPGNVKEETNFGPITYTVTCDGITEEFSSQDVICSERVTNLESDPSVTPKGYWNVGSGYIVEITDVSVETLSDWASHDMSNPTNNYLPKGTVDYGSRWPVYADNGQTSYRMLRCGVRVYNAIRNAPHTYYSRAVDCYYGTLPDHNEIHIASLTQEGHHTYLTLDCMWKAPFFFDFEEQEYQDAASRRYIVEEFDARYVDITFCYATQVTGEPQIPQDHPLFERAEILQNTSDMTLRLWLKRPGGLYGWDAYYNEDDQLVFQFLNPVTVKAADNPYGADLTGVTVMLDVGHGGEDTGAAGTDWGGTLWTERQRNQVLADAVCKELESIGATVVMNHTDVSQTVTQRERILLLKEVAPDYCLAIHHNWAADPEQNGYEAGFFTIYSQRAAEHSLYATRAADIYRSDKLTWFYYYVCRQTICPVVLSENGYMSNVQDLTLALKEDTIARKAQALTQAVANYYLEMNGLYTLEK